MLIGASCWFNGSFCLKSDELLQDLREYVFIVLCECSAVSLGSIPGTIYMTAWR
jgi:hypothetical protein